MDKAYAAEMAEWQAKRMKALKDPKGYLSLVGLCWLQIGENSFGSAATHDCQFPAGLPETIGRYDIADQGISVSIEPDVEVYYQNQPVQHMQILTDADPGGPTILESGTFNWFVIKRGDALGIRVRNSKSELLQSFEPVERFTIKQDWRVQGQFHAYAEPRNVSIPSVLGTDSIMISLGTVSINVQNDQRELVALKTGDVDRLFFVIGDGLSGDETYGGGRFLTSEPIQPDGSVVLDF
ncbi:MAG: DUF1684 domain-containing protein, partial [Chloroflexota bacterium]